MKLGVMVHEGDHFRLEHYEDLVQMRCDQLNEAGLEAAIVTNIRLIGPGEEHFVEGENLAIATSADGHTWLV